MSLKVFHVLFITLSIILCVGCAAWSFASGTMPYFGGACALSAVVLIAYECVFIRKAKQLIT
jgi:hypothetical protein